jgi:4-hydroxy-tetrahydrodipicolinate synthase
VTPFNGLSAFPITPADESGRVDTEALSRILMPIVAAKAGSVGLLGSTGTYVYLNREERRRAVKTATETINKALPLIVGIGALRTSDAVTYAQDAQEAGATALLLAPVSYTPLTQDEVYAHFSAIAEATDLPICIYNNPSTTHFSFDLPLLHRLAEKSSIAAVKMPLPASGTVRDDLAQLRTNLPDGFSIGYSGDWGCADALLAGADTWYSVIGGILPDVSLALTKAAQAGDRGQAYAKNAALEPLWSLFKEYGSLRVVYVIAQHLSLTNAQPPRPILPFNTEARARIVKALGALEI